VRCGGDGDSDGAEISVGFRRGMVVVGKECDEADSVEQQPTLKVGQLAAEAAQ